MVIYKGYRVPDPKSTGRTDTADRAVVLICLDGGVDPTELRMSELGARRSPDGYNWGYGGSGPHALAHSLLTFHSGEALADKLYREFTRAVISRLPQGGPWHIEGSWIDEWIRRAS